MVVFFSLVTGARSIGSSCTGTTINVGRNGYVTVHSVTRSGAGQGPGCLRVTGYYFHHYLTVPGETGVRPGNFRARLFSSGIYGHQCPEGQGSVCPVVLVLGIFLQGGWYPERGGPWGCRAGDRVQGPGTGAGADGLWACIYERQQIPGDRLPFGSAIRPAASTKILG